MRIIQPLRRRFSSLPPLLIATLRPYIDSSIFSGIFPHLLEAKLHSHDPTTVANSPCPPKSPPANDSSHHHHHLLLTLYINLTMSRHHPDLVMCRKAPGISLGRLCDKCDGKCPVCDSYVRPTTLARVCDECSFGNYQNKCIVCGGEGISDAFYCFECTRLEKDRDGCPKIINLGSSRTDLFYQKKNFRNQ